ncbi:MAG: response regulator [Caulobacterales bacterium]|jgi:two-component system response regulator FixJ|nr:response regulator [Caulobacterales bacterium]
MSDPVVHIVDDDPGMRESVAFLLDTENLATRLYDGAQALLARVGELEPGCIVTDIRMPEMNGLELVGELKKCGVTHPVIVLTGHADVGLAVDAMKAGVLDFLEKPFQDETLLNAVRAALAKGEGESGKVKERAEIEARLSQLTPRERDVFEAVVAGDSNKAAAIRLGISPRTVEIYRANVMDKMQARTLSDLVRMGLLRGDA